MEKPCNTCGVTMVVRGARGHAQKQCAPCYRQSMKGERNPNWKGKSICARCNGFKHDNAATDICGKCYRAEFHKGLPHCHGCNEKLSRYDSLKSGTGFCRRCYKGNVTRRWNPSIPDEERNSGPRNKNPKHHEWRMSVFRRDNFTCRKCGDTKGRNLAAHHVEDWKNNKPLRFEISNGITFCNPCHRRFHSKYGNTPNNQAQVEDYLSIITAAP